MELFVLQNSSMARMEIKSQGAEMEFPMFCNSGQTAARTEKKEEVKQQLGCFSQVEVLCFFYYSAPLYLKIIGHLFSILAQRYIGFYFVSVL